MKSGSKLAEDQETDMRCLELNPLLPMHDDVVLEASLVVRPKFVGVSYMTHTAFSVLSLLLIPFLPSILTTEIFKNLTLASSSFL